jgi:8-oxo-dGTP pyrophosphatase MutT (NUDIX family)
MHPYHKSLTATVYIVHREKVLLHLHKKYNTWFPVGGHLSPDELPHLAARREALEESGFAVTLIDHCVTNPSLGRVDRVPSPFLICHEGIGHAEEFLDFIYIARLTDENGGDMPVPVSGEGESHTFRWFSLAELRDPDTDLKIHVRNTAIAALEAVREG